MFVIEVIPLKRGVQVDSLSYFSSESYPLGTLLTIPVRNQEIKGVVINVNPVSTTKTALKAATFSLKKLPFQLDAKALSPAFIETAGLLAERYACQKGAVIHALLTPEVRDGKIELPHTHHITKQETFTPEILQGTTEERYLAYRSLVRETFAHAGSILFVVPSSIEAEVSLERLSNGIEDRVILLSSGVGVKQLREAYTALGDFSKPKLIIATPSHAVLERHDIMTVIVEHSRSNHYRERTRPYLDQRDVLLTHAYVSGRRIILGDLLIRTEEESRRRDDIYSTYGETPKRIDLRGSLKVVEMIKKKDEPTAFQLFSDTALEAIKKTQKERGKVFLFAARRGLAPLVACVDCGHIFRSPDSGAPFSLVRTFRNGTEERWFVCGVSGHRERAADICPICGSWRLRERGIGIQHVYDELTKLLPNTPIILFDHTKASTFKKASFLRDKFYTTKGAIMLGTQMAIPYLTKPVTTSIVINMDALRATPTWRQQEETLSLLLTLREHTTETVYVQTRTEPDELIEYATRGSLERFYDEEIELRKVFNYPPFSVFIHLTWQGSKVAVEMLEEVIKKTLEGYTLATYAAPISGKDTVIKYGLIRYPSIDWPNKSLAGALRALPPSVRIVIDPDRII